MNKVRDADFMTKFPPALQKDPSMSALGKIIAEELHITADNIKKNIIYAQIDGLAQTWLDMLAYDLHVDWYDYDYPLEAKRNIIKDSIKVHQKLGTKYAVETALQNVYKGAGVSEWFEYGGKPYYFKIMIDTGGAGLPASAYADILDKIQFYKNLRSHCDGVYIKLDGGNARLDAAAGAGIGAVLKIKARTAEFIHARESVHIMTAGSFGERLKVKPFLEKQVHARETVKVMAELSQGNSIRIKAQTAENLKGGV